MIPAAFDYVRAQSVQDALTLLAEHGPDSKLIAGGHSLLPLMKLRLAQPSTLVDIRALPELTGISESGGVLHIGGGVRHREVAASEVVRTHTPLLAEAAGTIGDQQVRNRGTIGGSLAHADPAADLPAALLALDASVVLRGPSGDRVVAVEDFFVGFWETALEPDEILVEVRVPSAQGRPYAYRKFQQRAQDWATVGVAVLGGDPVRVALLNMAATPIRARGVEAALASGASAADAAAHADEGTNPSADLRADPDYRRHLSKVLTRQALEDLVRD